MCCLAHPQESLPSDCTVFHTRCILRACPAKEVPRLVHDRNATLRKFNDTIWLRSSVEVKRYREQWSSPLVCARLLRVLHQQTWSLLGKREIDQFI